MLELHQLKCFKLITWTKALQNNFMKYFSKCWTQTLKDNRIFYFIFIITCCVLFSILKFKFRKIQTNMQYQKFHQVRIIQDTNCHWLSLCLFVSFVLEALLLFLALLLFHSEHTANPVWHTSANPFSLCRVTTPRPPCWEQSFNLKQRNKGTENNLSPKWYQDACLGVSRWSEKQKNVVSIQ